MISSALPAILAITASRQAPSQASSLKAGMMRLIVGLSVAVSAVIVWPSAAIFPLWPESKPRAGDPCGTAIRARGMGFSVLFLPRPELRMPGHGFLLSPEQTIAPGHDSPSAYNRRRSRRLGSRLATRRGRAERAAQRNARRRRDDARASDGRTGRIGLLEQLPLGRRDQQCRRPAPC